MPPMIFPTPEGQDDLHGTYATDRQFEIVWAPKGWRRVAEVSELPTAEPVVALADPGPLGTAPSIASGGDGDVTPAEPKTGRGGRTAEPKET